ncbi:MAG: YybS family protein [Proteobacteria bacterium]|nr:YybS family protein [Pseudomonadota bacterium]
MSHITHNEPHKELLMATAITTLIALAGLYIPVVGLLVSVFVPLPILFYRSRLGRPRGVLILIAVTLIVASAMRWRSMTSAVYFFELGLIGLILSEMFEMDLSLEKTVVVTTGIVLGTGAVILALYGLVSAESIWDQISNYLHGNLELALSIYREMDVSEEKIGILAQSMEGILYVMLRIMPAIVIVSTLLVVWSNLLLARPLLKSGKLFCPDFGALNKWKAPEPLVWLVILSGILVLLPHKGFKLFGVNGLIIMMTIYFFQGIAIVSFYFEKKQFPKILRGILYGLIAIQQFVLLLVIAAGFFDVWIDFRRMKKGVDDKNESDTQRDY